MKQLQGAADLLASRARQQGRVTTVVFQVTDRCNYGCVHCYQEHGEGSGELSHDEVVRILEELAAAGVLFLTLMGGEFFMRRDADEIVARAHALGFAIKIKSTGHHITDKRADFLATLRPLQVDLSLYAATRHLHEGVTQAPGSYERTLAAARRLIARKVAVQLNTSIMESNATEVAELKRLASEIGASYSFDPKITAMENTEVRPVLQRMSAATLRAFYGSAIPDVVADMYSEPAPRPLDTTPCRAAQQTVAIGPRGEVWPCIRLPLEGSNLRTQSFQSIYDGAETLQQVRGLSWATLGECSVCPVRPYCQRCHAMALLEHGEMRGPSLEACRHAVVIRDSLRERGLIAATETAMPPTWDRVDPHGQHHRGAGDGHAVRRPASLRVIG